MLQPNESSLVAPPAFAEADADTSLASGGLRVAEEVGLAFLVYMTVACFELPLLARERITVTALNMLAVAVIFLLARVTKERSVGLLAIVRDWFPAALILLAYRESGLFFMPEPAHRLDYVFVRWDFALLHNKWALGVLSALRPWLQYYLELVYLLCYPIVPAGLGCLLVAERRLRSQAEADSSFRCASLEMAATQSKIPNLRSKLAVDHFWTAVLIATLFCYTVYPFFPLTPPRLLFHDLPGPTVPPFLRIANLWVLGNYGVQACIFPSGHVAAVTAVALTVRAHRPRVGVVFLVAAASIAVATVILRYHYAADALAGALVGWAAFRISARVHCRRERAAKQS